MSMGLASVVGLIIIIIKKFRKNAMKDKKVEKIGMNRTPAKQDADFKAGDDENPVFFPWSWGKMVEAGPADGTYIPDPKTGGTQNEGTWLQSGCISVRDIALL
ncbi:hypothetical protein [uncultured Oscillibacter sp.]|uniref:hypothetical protein n=1 Tax=uncultured Oscillibacter sp. TaxID=876091 RepID=UPI00280B71CC|nr:hypothetical protein [uncultured Oscillibacter sp.]